MNTLKHKNDYYIICLYKYGNDADKREAVQELSERYQHLIWKNVHIMKSTIGKDNSVSEEDVYQELFLIIYKALEWSDPQKIRNRDTYTFHSTYNGYMRSYSKYSITSRLQEYNQLTFYNEPLFIEEYYDYEAYDRAYLDFIKSLTTEEKIIVEQCEDSCGEITLKKLLKSIDDKQNYNKIKRHKYNIKRKMICCFQKEGFLSEHRRYKMI